MDFHQFQLDTAQLLWIHAPAGHGKTMIAAKITNSLLNDSDMTVAYFFYSSEDGIRREPLSAVRAWIHQIMMRHDNAFEIVEQYMYAQSSQAASEPDLWRLLKAIVQTVSDVALIIDGLDECSRADDWRNSVVSSRETFLLNLISAVSKTTARVLVLSRDEPDIRSQLQPGILELSGLTGYELKVSEEELRADITLFSRSIVDKRLPKKDSTLRQELSTQLTKKCDGMFLWVRLQEGNLRGTRNRKQLMKAINDVPSGLEHAFERSWKDILKLPPRDKDRAITILRWVVSAFEPLTVNELIVALLIKDDDVCDDLEVDDLPDCIDDDYVNGEILRFCGSLLEVRAVDSEQPVETRTVNLVHFSVKEFLLSNTNHLQVSCRPEEISLESYKQDDYIARLCLRYLNYESSWLYTGEGKTSDKIVPFFNYAALYWDKHISNQDSSSTETIRLTNAFFSPKNPNWYAWRARHEHLRQIRSAWGDMIHYAARLGLNDAIEYLVNYEMDQISAIDGIYGTPLQNACAKGHITTVRLLISLGATLDTQSGCNGSAINAAVANHNLEIVRYLITLGASLTIPDAHGQTVVHFAVIKNSSLEMLELLIQNGANPSGQSKNGWSPLFYATRMGSTQFVRYLLEIGVYVDASDFGGWTPLMLAIFYRHSETARLLLDWDANISHRNDGGRTSLAISAQMGDAEMVTLLLEKGADISATDSDGSTPVLIAAAKGHSEAVKVLLENGANALTIDKDGDSPLEVAVGSGHSKIVEQLLMKGVPVDSIGDGGNTALHHSAYLGFNDTVKVLLKYQANVRALTVDGHTALHLAAQGVAPSVIKTLVDSGAEYSSLDMYGRSCLDWAALYPPCFEAMVHLEGHYPPTPREVSESRMKESLKYLIHSLRSRTKGSDEPQKLSSSWQKLPLHRIWSRLGKILIFLQNDEAASIAYEQMMDTSPTESFLVKVCDRCMIGPITKICHICTCCPDIDLCESCYNPSCDPEPTSDSSAYLQRCRGHRFLKVPRCIWKELEPGYVDKDGKTVDAWLSELLVQYA